MAHSYIRNFFVYLRLILIWNPVLLFAKSGNPMLKTLQPWEEQHTVLRLPDSVGMKAKRILKFSNLMSKIIKCMHSLLQNLACSFLQHSCNERKQLSLWESRRTKADNIQHGAVFDSCSLCLFFWKQFKLGFLENAFIQPGIFPTVVFISRDPPIREHLLSPNKICF